VFSGLVMAWRRAIWPTRTSPRSSKATTDGVRRAPSSLVMTLGSLPSMMQTTELVVPRSMPMILPMFVPLCGPAFQASVLSAAQPKHHPTWRQHPPPRSVRRMHGPPALGPSRTKPPLASPDRSRARTSALSGPTPRSNHRRPGPRWTARGSPGARRRWGPEAERTPVREALGGNRQRSPWAPQPVPSLEHRVHAGPREEARRQGGGRAPRRSVRRYVRTWEGPTNAAGGLRSRSLR
jgi:hypothetical protein